jgi:hypothetical protein
MVSDFVAACIPLLQVSTTFLLLFAIIYTILDQSLQPSESDHEWTLLTRTPCRPSNLSDLKGARVSTRCESRQMLHTNIGRLRLPIEPPLHNSRPGRILLAARMHWTYFNLANFSDRSPRTNFKPSSRHTRAYTHGRWH